MVLDASLLNTQHYKVQIKGKVEPSREGVAPFPTSWCSSYRKGSLRVTLDYDYMKRRWDPNRHSGTVSNSSQGVFYIQQTSKTGTSPSDADFCPTPNLSKYFMHVVCLYRCKACEEAATHFG